ncbi:MAG TPA: type III secretion system cytoplasmic ring protein SctQ [Chlamydiales bacterium]|nr:type III secretion system cytoplasmic ring protein SctQ [Chlamydiales bacterium]
MAHPPLAWVRRISAELDGLNQIPLFGNAPPFDWERFSSLLASRFGIQKLKVHPQAREWRKPKEGLGKNRIVMPVLASPLKGHLLWIMAEEDIARFTSWMLNGKTKTRALSSDLLQEGFYRYLVLEVLDAIQGLQPLQNLTLHLNEEEQFSLEEEAFCVDVEIAFDHRSCWGRLAIPREFRASWIQHFSTMPSEYIPTETARMTPLVLGIKTGSVLLHRDDWKKLKEGDFVVLDQGSYDARKGTGAATLMLGATPLFNVKIKQNKIELLDYAFYYEDTNMEQKAPSHPPQEVSLQPAEGEVVAIKELPLYVTVELARLKISLDQLMHLNPGNTLELPVHPEQGVSLTVNGQKIGRAELLYLGETLGLRILEVG